MDFTADSPAQAHVVPRGRRLEVWLPLVIVALDQLTKMLIRRTLAVHDSVVVIPGILDFTHVRNTGAAFGILDGVDFPYKTAIIAVIAVAALAGVMVYASQLARDQLLARTGLTLIIGGAAGNLIDRLTVGSVVDFVDVYLGTWHFWAFNVADSAITVGVTAMILDMIGVGRHVSKTV
jgi:signal peptidase II